MLIIRIPNRILNVPDFYKSARSLAFSRLHMLTVQYFSLICIDLKLHFNEIENNTHSSESENCRNSFSFCLVNDLIKLHIDYGNITFPLKFFLMVKMSEKQLLNSVIFIIFNVFSAFLLL